MASRYRPVPQLGAIQSLLPFNSAVSSARLTSCLSIDSRSSRSYSQGMPFGRSLLQRESLYRVSGEERSPEILILFHSSGLTSNQWRKLKNLWFPGRTLFRPSCFGTGKKKRFFAQLLIVQVPLVYCIWPKKHRIGWSSYLLGTPWTKICFYYMGNIDLL
uniref:Ribosomal protein L10 n=1 Tax=Salix viminalis TaxID=40686 RepID=A0A6N2L284_SALVM